MQGVVSVSANPATMIPVRPATMIPVKPATMMPSLFWVVVQPLSAVLPATMMPAFAKVDPKVMIAAKVIVAIVFFIVFLLKFFLIFKFCRNSFASFCPLYYNHRAKACHKIPNAYKPLFMNMLRRRNFVFHSKNNLHLLCILSSQYSLIFS